MTPQQHDSDSQSDGGDVESGGEDTDIDDELLDGRKLRETAPSGPTEIDDDIIPNVERSLPLSLLTATKNQRDLLDYFLSNELPDRGLSKKRVAEECGISANGVRRHIDVFVDFGLVEITTSADTKFKRYTTTDNEVYDVLIEANNVLAAHYVKNNDGSDVFEPPS